MVFEALREHVYSPTRSALRRAGRRGTQFVTFLLDLEPVLYLPMDDGDGSTMRDASGNGLDGTYVNDPDVIDGPIKGNARSFNGNDQHALVGSQPSLSGFDDFSVVFVGRNIVRPTFASAYTVSVYSTTDSRRSWAVRPEASAMGMIVSPNGSAFTDLSGLWRSGAAAPGGDNVWHLYVASRIGDQWQAYIDGQAYGDPQTFAGTLYQSPADFMLMDRPELNSPTRGDLASVAVIGSGLSAADVLDLWKSLGGKEKITVSGWTFDQNFDTGSADTSSAITDETIRIVGDNGKPSTWAVFAVRLTGVLAGCPTVEVDLTDHEFMDGSDLNQVGFCWWTYDPNSDQWFRFNEREETSATLLTFRQSRPFDKDTVYVTSHAGYPWARTEAKVSEWIQSEYVESPAGVTDFIVGNLTERTNYNGRTVPALPIYALHITDHMVGGSKNQVVLTNGNHPQETHGDWDFEGMIDWLLSDDPKAATVRQYCDIYAFPQVNPQGRHGGYHNESPESPTTNHNRQWETSVASESTAMIMPLVRALTSDAIHVWLDFHSSLGAPGPATQMWYDVTDVPDTADYVNAVAAYADVDHADDKVAITDSTRDFATTTSSVLQILVSPEETNPIDLSLADLLAKGAAFGKGLADIIDAGTLPEGPS